MGGLEFIDGREGRRSGPDHTDTVLVRGREYSRDKPTDQPLSSSRNAHVTYTKITMLGSESTPENGSLANGARVAVGHNPHPADTACAVATAFEV